MSLNLNRLLDEPEFKVGDEVVYKSGFFHLYFVLKSWVEEEDNWMTQAYRCEDDKSVYSMTFKPDQIKLRLKS